MFPTVGDDIGDDRMLILRRILFTFFVLIYLVSCPLLILYALGYIVRPEQSQAITKTGLIAIASVPDGASVYLEGRRFAEKTPTVLMELIPGTYRLKVVKRNYQPWSAEIIVKGGKATVLEKVILLDKRFKSKIVNTEKFDSLIPLRQTPYALLTTGERLSDVWLLDAKEKKMNRLIAGKKRFLDAKVRAFHHSKGADHVIAQIEQDAKETFLRARLSVEDAELRDLGRLISARAEQISFSTRDEDKVFYLEKHYLNRVDLKAEALYPSILTNVWGFGLSENHLYVTKDYDVIRMNHNAQDPDWLLQNRTLGQKLFEPGQRVRIEAFEEGVLLFHDIRGRLISNRSPYLHVKKDVRGFEGDRQTSRIVFWTKRKLGLLDFSAQETKHLENFEKETTIEWLYEDGSDIQRAFWVYEGSHILLKDHDQLMLLECFLPGPREPKLLAKIDKKPAFFYHEESGDIYFLSAGDRFLIRAKLLPSEQIELPSQDKEQASEQDNKKR